MRASIAAAIVSGLIWSVIMIVAAYLLDIDVIWKTWAYVTIGIITWDVSHVIEKALRIRWGK